MSWKSISGMLTANHSAIGLRSNSFSARWRFCAIHRGSPFHHEIWSTTPSFRPFSGAKAYSMSASLQPRLYLLRSRSNVDMLCGCSSSGNLHYPHSNNSGRLRRQQLDLVVALTQDSGHVGADPVETGGVHRAWVDRRADVTVEQVGQVDLADDAALDARPGDERDVAGAVVGAAAAVLLHPPAELAGGDEEDVELDGVEELRDPGGQIGQQALLGVGLAAVGVEPAGGHDDDLRCRVGGEQPASQLQAPGDGRPALAVLVVGAVAHRLVESRHGVDGSGDGV